MTSKYKLQGNHVSLSVLLTPVDMELLDRQAEEIGIPKSTLARVWIRDRLKQGAPHITPAHQKEELHK